MQSASESYKLANNVNIPCIGFGTWQMPNDEKGVDAVKTAIKMGYRHIDTAAVYENEESVGKGVRESGVSRSEIFVTSKLWNSNRGYESTLKAFDKTMERLGLDYLDLYLIHWPEPVKESAEHSQAVNLQTWRAFEELYAQGRIKSIGVSNFMAHHLKPLMESAQTKPMANQIEFHPGYMQKETLDYCQNNDVVVEAWSPLGSGKLLENETLVRLAHKYGRSVAQICLRWCLQHKTLPLPKSVTESRIRENLEVFDFELSDGDMASIDAMPYSGGSGLEPDTVSF